MKTIFCSIVLAFIAISCESPNEVNTNFDYSIEQRIGCNCDNYGWVKLFITADSVSSAIRLSDNSELIIDEIKPYKSINNLFKIIENTDTTEYEITFKIDSLNMFPYYLYYNPKPIIVNNDTLIIMDGQMLYETRNYINLK